MWHFVDVHLRMLVKTALLEFSNIFQQELENADILWYDLVIFSNRMCRYFAIECADILQ